MVDIDQTAPDFRLPGTAGEEIRKYRLRNYTTSGAVVLAFYPFDFSPVCTEELCTFRDATFLSVTEDIDIFGISLDGCYAHQQFIRKYDLSLPLLSDTRGCVTERYGYAYDEFEHHEGVSKRALVVIDDDNIIRYQWQTDNAYQNPNLHELREIVLTLTDNKS